MVFSAYGKLLVKLTCHRQLRNQLVYFLLNSADSIVEIVGIMKKRRRVIINGIVINNLHLLHQRMKPNKIKINY
jgi:hypothetical protein